MHIFSPRGLAMAAIAFSLLACSNDEPAPQDPYLSRSIALSQAEDMVSDNCNNFAWNLFEKVGAAGKRNAVVSPLSATICFSMLANATAGNSQAQVQQALGFANIDIADVNSFNKKLVDNICSLDPNIKLSIANSMWYDPKVAPKSQFVSQMKETFDIESFVVNHQSLASDVNKWCSKKTNGLIPQILNQGEDLDFALLNALYFKGIWQCGFGFDKENTRSEIFNNADGSTANVQSMNKKEVYDYCRSEGWRAVSIPFGGGGFRFSVILPDDGITIDQCLASVRECDIPRLGKNATAGDWRTKGLYLRIPKFKVGYQVDLKDALTEMGITDIFDENLANFSNLTDQKMMVGIARQKVSFELNEEGAEAAAVTVVGMDVTSLNPNESEYESFYVDRPFAYMISERSSGAILFLGRIDSF